MSRDFDWLESRYTSKILAPSEAMFHIRLLSDGDVQFSDTPANYLAIIKFVYRFQYKCPMQSTA